MVHANADAVHASVMCHLKIATQAQAAVLDSPELRSTQICECKCHHLTQLAQTCDPGEHTCTYTQVEVTSVSP